MIAETLGDLGRMIERAQALVPIMDEARQALVEAHEQLLHEAAAQRASFEKQLAKLGERAQTQVVTHIVARVDEAYRRKVQDQTHEVRDTLRTLLAVEIESAAQRASSGRSTGRREPSYEFWLTHLAVAACAATLTWICTSIMR